MDGFFRFVFLVMILVVPATSFAKESPPTLYTGRDYRDPTTNPLLTRPVQEKPRVVQEVIHPPSLRVQGVIWGGDAPKAIVDETVVTKGDILPSGVEILEISGTGIKVLYRGKIFLLLPNGAVEER